MSCSIEFQSKFAGESKFAMRCCIAKMKNPLNIIITTTVYSIVPLITYINVNNQATIVHYDRDNVIDFGNILPKVPATLKFEITNAGKVTFHYSWDLAMDQKVTSKRPYTVTVQPRQGCITSESRSSCQLTLIALKKVQIQDHTIFIKINKGPVFRLLLKVTARQLSYEMNFNHYDFGPRYIQETSIAPYRIDIRLTNFEETPCIVECKFEDVSHMIAKLEHLSEAVTGQSSISIPIYFRPIEPIHYSETLIFLINSTIEKKVTITGEGIPYKVCLVNPRDRSIDLGNIPAGKTIVRKIPIANKGRASIELTFDLIRNLTFFNEHRYRVQPCSFEQKIPEERKSLDMESTDQTSSSLSQILSIEPSEPTILLPNKQIDILLKFAPVSRMKAFTNKIAVQMHSTILPLSIIRGSCIGADFHLNRTHISFGAIVEGCTCETKLILINSGDLGAKFKWNTEKLHPNFHLAPLAGYCSSGMDVTFVVTFQPVRLSNTIQGEAVIEIEKYQRLCVTMSGGCCKLPDPIDTVQFVVKVRENLTKQVSIANDTNQIWQIEIVVTGDYFAAMDILHVPPKESSFCSITYAPLVMTTRDHLHKGTILVKLPDGKAPMLYTLVGTSLPPEPLAKIARQFPAKTKYAELLPVFNWLNQSQRFICKIEPINELKVVYSFTGNNKLDVPANSQRDYRALFHCYKESNFHFRITFANQEGEYQYYEVRYEVTKPEVLESIKMTTTVRVPVCHLLKLDNPLNDQSVNYSISCSHCDITVYDVPKLVLPLSTERIKIKFHPLLVLDTTVSLDIHCPELGIFPYELRLKATPAPLEKTIHVIAFLGSSLTFFVTISNCSKKNTEFTIEVDDPSFTCDKNISVPGLKEGTLNVVYEPNDIQNVTATLTASSKIAGEFIFPIAGTVALPKAQGPFTIKPNTAGMISFKNVFKVTKTFEYILDDPSLFSIKISSETIESKKSVNIIVSLSSRDAEDYTFNENRYSIAGKLIVSCTDPTFSHVNWIYYLRGAPD